MLRVKAHEYQINSSITGTPLDKRMALLIASTAVCLISLGLFALCACQNTFPSSSLAANSLKQLKIEGSLSFITIGSLFIIYVITERYGHSKKKARAVLETQPTLINLSLPSSIRSIQNQTSSALSPTSSYSLFSSTHLFVTPSLPSLQERSPPLSSDLISSTQTSATPHSPQTQASLSSSFTTDPSTVAASSHQASPPSPDLTSPTQTSSAPHSPQMQASLSTNLSTVAASSHQALPPSPDLTSSTQTSAAPHSSQTQASLSSSLTTDLSTIETSRHQASPLSPDLTSSTQTSSAPHSSQTQASLSSSLTTDLSTIATSSHQALPSAPDVISPMQTSAASYSPQTQESSQKSSLIQGSVRAPKRSVAKYCKMLFNLGNSEGTTLKRGMILLSESNLINIITGICHSGFAYTYWMHETTKEIYQRNTSATVPPFRQDITTQQWNYAHNSKIILDPLFGNTSAKGMFADITDPESRKLFIRTAFKCYKKKLKSKNYDLFFIDRCKKCHDYSKIIFPELIKLGAKLPS